MMVVPAPGAQQQVSRTVLAMLIVSAVVAVLPHLLRLWPWLWGVGAIAVGWATMVQLGRWQPPSVWTKGALGLLGFVLVAVSARSLGLDATIGVLVVAYQLKLIETQRHRDGFVVVMMAYFVIATWFLFDQTIASAAWGLAATVVATAALVAQSTAMTRVRVGHALRTSLVLCLIAAPLAALVFVLFPRVAPLWNVPMPTTARIGLSDRVSPGSIAALTSDDSVVFRATFDGRVPPPMELYWRAVSYYEFDNRSWAQGSPRGVPDAELVAWKSDRVTADWLRPLTPRYRYRVIMEPSDRRWLFALGSARGIERDIGVLRDERLFNRDAVTSTIAYTVESGDIHGDLPPWLAARSLQLPPDENDRTRRLARYLRALHAGDEALVLAILRYFRDRGFAYTLTPGTLPERDVIDAFLFDARRGFCAHYAGAMVYLLRAAGIPARMAGGYLGGEVNPLGGFVTVRQYDAHAWVEVWLRGKGWRRFDPTGAIAPERIENGISGLTVAASRGAPEPWALRGMDGFGPLLATVDSMQHRWNMWVVGFDASVQQRALDRYLGGSSWRVVGTTLFALLGVAVVAAWLVLRSQALLRALGRWRPERALERWGAARGTPRAPQETLADYGDRLAAARPADRERIAHFVTTAYTELYAPPTPNAASARNWLRASWGLYRPGVSG